MSAIEQLEQKAKSKINSILDPRAKSEIRHLFFQFREQCAIWEDYAIKNRYINPFDTENEQTLNKIKYHRLLMKYGRVKFEELGVL